MIKKFKKPLIFVLILIPIAIVGGYFTGIYSFDSSTPENQALLLEQIGSRDMLNIIMAAQTVGYAVFCGFFGYILAEKLGLIRSFKLSKKPLLLTLGLSVIVAGVVSALEYAVFCGAIPEVAASYVEKPTAANWIASLTYGGVIEELMMRLFLMSLIAFIVWKLFYKKRESVPTGVLIGANIAAAVLFAAGHLPTTVMMFGGITPLVLLRCFLLNGAGAVVFGRLYRKHGIQYAMIAHMLFHVVLKVSWILFV